MVLELPKMGCSYILGCSLVIPCTDTVNCKVMAVCMYNTPFYALFIVHLTFSFDNKFLEALG
jgi:hypothetical protein